MIRKGIETYEIKSVENDNDFIVKYYFKDIDLNDFMVQFKNDTVGSKSSPMLGNSYEITWYVLDDKVNKWSVTKIVNTDIWRTLHTIFGDILEFFLLERTWVTSIRLEGLSKENEKINSITQRTKFYLRHLRNNPVPMFKLENRGNKILLTKNKF
jgi:hypothetical protein